MRFAKRFYTNPGSPEHVLYSPKVSKNGEIELVKSGVENTDEIIQSFEESTDINVILARVRAGDLAALHKRTGSYGDFTKMPQTFAEALQLQIDSNRLFNNLPIDVKQKFDNDPAKFFASSGTEEWFKKIENVLPDEVKKMVFPADTKVDVPASPAKEEVKE